MAVAGGNDVLLVDGGDFMMGTLFQLGRVHRRGRAALMQAVGYDAAAIGNHEYDWTPKGLAGILKAAYTVLPPVDVPAAGQQPEVQRHLGRQTTTWRCWPVTTGRSGASSSRPCPAG